MIVRFSRKLRKDLLNFSLVKLNSQVKISVEVSPKKKKTVFSYLYLTIPNREGEKMLFLATKLIWFQRRGKKTMKRFLNKRKCLRSEKNHSNCLIFQKQSRL